MCGHRVFCAADPGGGDLIEPLPVDRRLASDAARGRLRVVCRRRRRWKPTPLEERWEVSADGLTVGDRVRRRLERVREDARSLTERTRRTNR